MSEPLTTYVAKKLNRIRDGIPGNTQTEAELRQALADLAATGKFGEAANVAKKLNRIRDGIPGNTQTEAELRQAPAGLWFTDANGSPVNVMAHVVKAHGIDLSDSGCSVCAHARSLADEEAPRD